MLNPDFVEHPHRVRLGRGLHDPSQHELFERVIAQDFEAEPVVPTRQHRHSGALRFPVITAGRCCAAVCRIRCGWNPAIPAAAARSPKDLCKAS
jgi:hypothetical protein